MAQRTLYEAEAEVEARNWETSLFLEINQEFEPQQLQLHQASRWADLARRDKISLYGELELRNRLFQEDHARDCQEIEELRRIFAKKLIEQDKQELVNKLSLHQERHPTTVSQLLTQTRE